METDRWREWFLVSWMYRIAKEKPMPDLPNVHAFPGDRADRCEYGEVPRIMKPGDGFTYRDSVLKAAVNEAIQWGRSWSDLWHYDMDAKQRGVFIGFADFSKYADALYKETI